MENSFAMACTEVLEILKNLPRNEYEKIPKEEIELLERQKDKSYIFNVDKSLRLEEINISKKANAIIVILWEKYFASQNEKEKLYLILKKNYQIQEQEKNEKYNYNNIFKKKNKESTALSDIKEQNSLVEIKEQKWYEKLWNKILNIFRR